MRVIENFENIANFTSGDNGFVAAEDTIKTYGEHSVRFYTNTVGEVFPFLQRNGATYDLSDMETMTFSVFLPNSNAEFDAVANNPFAIYFAQDVGFVNYVLIRTLGYLQEWHQGWNHFKFAKKDFAETGAVNWDNDFVVMRIRHYGTANKAINCYWDNIRINDDTKPQIILYWDDARSGFYENAYEYMEERGIKHTIPVISSQVGNDGYMTLDQLRELYNVGHDLVNHTENHPYLTELSDSSIESEIKNCKDFLEENLFFRGSKFLAIPYSDYNQRVRNIAILQGCRLVRSLWRGLTILKMEDMFDQRMYIATLPTTTEQNIRDAIDAAITYGTTVIFMNHSVEDVPAPGGYDISTDLAEFLADYIEESGIESITLYDWMNEHYGYYVQDYLFSLGCEVKFGGTVVTIDNIIIAKVTAFTENISVTEDDVTAAESVIEGTDTLHGEFCSIETNEGYTVEGIVIENENGRNKGQSDLKEAVEKGKMAIVRQVKNTGYGEAYSGFFSSYDENSDTSGVYRFKATFRSNKKYEIIPSS